MTEEVWKDIPGYEFYKISTFGRIKSYGHTQISNITGNVYTRKEKFLKPHKNKRGYITAILIKNGEKKHIAVHRLIAMAFLNLNPNGNLVVHHINNNPSDNRLSNLKVVTQRENAFTHHKGSSKYKGVYLHKKSNKWMSRITINNKLIYLGIYENELDAHKAYQSKLKASL